jgi:hypothetical protein
MFLDLRLHLGVVGGNENIPVIKFEAIEGIERLERQIVVHISARFLKHLPKDELHQEEGGPPVEGKTIRTKGRVSAAHRGPGLKNSNIEPAVSQDHGARQSAGSGTHNDDSFFRFGV